MTRKEKMSALYDHCNMTPCSECVLKNLGWEKPTGVGCLKIAYSSDKDLNNALELIGYNNLDPVNKPAHYTDGKIEVIDFIEDKKLGFCLGNAIKYISRAGKKDPDKEVEDLKKAAWYIDRRIKELEE